MSTSNTRTVLAKTADYTVTTGDCTAIITNRGAAGAVNITLPAQSSVGAGFWVEVYCVAAQTLTVTTTTTDTLVTANDATADSIAWDQSNQKIGNSAKFVADGTGWLCLQNAAIATTTVYTQTIAT